MDKPVCKKMERYTEPIVRAKAPIGGPSRQFNKRTLIIVYTLAAFQYDDSVNSGTFDCSAFLLDLDWLGSTAHELPSGHSRGLAKERPILFTRGAELHQ